MFAEQRRVLDCIAKHEKSTGNDTMFSLPDVLKVFEENDFNIKEVQSSFESWDQLSDSDKVETLIAFMDANAFTDWKTDLQNLHDGPSIKATGSTANATAQAS